MGTTEQLAAVAGGYALTILDSVQREYPNHLRHSMDGPDDRPTPREVHPAFYGCYDWHSAVEMHWALVRLLRLIPIAVAADEVRRVLDRHLTAEALQRETAYFRERRSFERPYGWCWTLMLAAELGSWDDPDARRWASAMSPLADRITDLYLEWLPRATYPIRDGAHANSAFGLARAVPHAVAVAEGGDAALLDAITVTARRWFLDDCDYPASWEPGGADFLSPTLTEAELMGAVLAPAEFTRWFDRFLPQLPASLLTPAAVSDPTDGQIAHLHGLNLYRAFGFQRLGARLPPEDPRRAALEAASRRHAEASLPAVSGSDYMVEHWLACYAVLLLG